MDARPLVGEDGEGGSFGFDGPDRLTIFDFFPQLWPMLIACSVSALMWLYVVHTSPLLRELLSPLFGL
jgi:hypothetical protein